MKSSAPRIAGFTLLEVLVALAVLAISLGAVIRVAGNSTATITLLRDRTLAGWVASNAVNELMLSPNWPAPGNLQGREQMAGQEWTWRMRVLNTDDPELRRVEVAVSVAEGAETVGRLVAFIGRPGG